MLRILNCARTQQGAWHGSRKNERDCRIVSAPVNPEAIVRLGGSDIVTVATKCSNRLDTLLPLRDMKISIQRSQLWIPDTERYHLCWGGL